ncbi:MAG: hypothetical protein IIZ04_02685 [Aeriscardovia sp.]|nr:hypothetical protein [Aeriscardovia sp.]
MPFTIADALERAHMGALDVNQVQVQVDLTVKAFNSDTPFADRWGSAAERNTPTGALNMKDFIRAVGEMVGGDQKWKWAAINSQDQESYRLLYGLSEIRNLLSSSPLEVEISAVRGDGWRMSSEGDITISYNAALNTSAMMGGLSSSPFKEHVLALFNGSTGGGAEGSYTFSAIKLYTDNGTVALDTLETQGETDMPESDNTAFTFSPSLRYNFAISIEMDQCKDFPEISGNGGSASLWEWITSLGYCPVKPITAIRNSFHYFGSHLEDVMAKSTPDNAYMRVHAGPQDIKPGQIQDFSQQVDAALSPDGLQSSDCITSGSFVISGSAGGTALNYFAEKGTTLGPRQYEIESCFSEPIEGVKVVLSDFEAEVQQ